MTQSVLTEIRRVTDKPIRFLINTHSHFDHVYTNHFFPEATVISTHRGREETKANRKVQGKHDALFVKLFSDVVVHLPGEKIIFCGDVFMNGMPPLPSMIMTWVANHVLLGSARNLKIQLDFS
jgi:glyoxylase-like metal-dependent hydrolase (beta-lactamase superfamily II)